MRERLDVCLCTDSHEHEQRERRQEAGQHEQQQADAVDADVVARCRTPESRRGARRTGSRPTPGRSGPEQQRRREHQQRHGQRDVADQRRSSLRRRSRRTAAASAPTSGSAMSEVRIGNVHQRRSPPQVVPEDRDHAEEQRRRVGADRAGLQPAQQRRSRRARPSADAVDGAVDHADVDALPQALARTTMLDRLDDGRVVELVDVVLVQQQRVQAGEARAPSRRRRARFCRKKKAARPMPASATATTRPSASARVPVVAFGAPAVAGRLRRPALVTGCAARWRVKLGSRKRSRRLRAAERVRHADVAGERPSRSPARSARSPSAAARRADAPCAVRVPWPRRARAPRAVRVAVRMRRRGAPSARSPWNVRNTRRNM